MGNALDSKKLREALRWIVGILRKHKVPFQITGGFAAYIYGSGRDPIDIDIDVPDSRLQDIISDVKEHITLGPKRFINDSFDVFLVSIRYKGQDIDISGCDSEKLFDRRKKRWIRSRNELSRSVKRRVLGLVVPIVSKDALIRYKKILMRRVDKLDLKALEKNITR